MQKLRVAVIGIGNMGKNHLRVYSELNQVDLIAVSDLDEALGKEAVKNYKINFYKNYLDLIKTEKLDLVSIVVPTKYHFQVAKDCIELGINILLEKPICLTAVEGEELLKIAEKKKIKLLVGHIERFNPAIIKTKKLIDSGKLGKITSIIARRVGGFPSQIKDADIAVDLSIHDVDIINYLLESLPKKIVIHKQNNHIQKRADSVDIFLEYESASAFVQSNWITPVKIRKLNITGTEGYLEVDYITQKIVFYKSIYKKYREKSKDFSDFILKFSDPEILEIKTKKTEPLKEEILFLIKSIQNNTKVNSKFALEALKIVTNTKL